jgi:hypothetical protein
MQGIISQQLPVYGEFQVHLNSTVLLHGFLVLHVYHDYDDDENTKDVIWVIAGSVA